MCENQSALWVYLHFRSENFKRAIPRETTILYGCIHFGSDGTTNLSVGKRVARLLAVRVVRRLAGQVLLGHLVRHSVRVVHGLDVRARAIGRRGPARRALARSTHVLF